MNVVFLAWLRSKNSQCNLEHMIFDPTNYSLIAHFNRSKINKIGIKQINARKYSTLILIPTMNRTTNDVRLSMVFFQPNFIASCMIKISTLKFRFRSFCTRPKSINIGRKHLLKFVLFWVNTHTHSFIWIMELNNRKMHQPIQSSPGKKFRT